MEERDHKSLVKESGLGTPAIGIAKGGHARAV